MEKNKITLPNNVEVTFYPENGTLGEMLGLAKSEDFLQETEVMKKIANFPPFNLLVYDKLMALGLYMKSQEVSVGVKNYDQECMINWVDMALSLRHHPIRVVEKTSVKGEMFERLKPRLDLDWIEYDSQTRVIREIQEAKCPIDKFLETAPVKREMYSLLFYDGKTEVMKMKIFDDIIKDYDKGVLLEGVKCNNGGRKIYDRPIEEVEEMLKKQHPEALIVREPLTYCSFGIEQRPWGCLPVKFERFYFDKMQEKNRKKDERNLTDVSINDVLERRKRILGEEM